jgi:molybdopterin converting factor small subunit
MRALSKDKPEVRVDGATVREVLDQLEVQCPGTRARLLDEKGEVRRYLNLFLNDEDVRFVGGLDAKVAAADRLTVIPAIAGGA